MNEPRLPTYDAIVPVTFDYAQGLAIQRDCVIHRNAAGEVYCFHSPLEHGPVHCDFCETPGNRVYLETYE